MTNTYKDDVKLGWIPESKMEGKRSGVYARKYTDADMAVINSMREKLGMPLWKEYQLNSMEQCGFDVHATAQALREKQSDTYIAHVPRPLKELKRKTCMHGLNCTTKCSPEGCKKYKEETPKPKRFMHDCAEQETCTFSYCGPDCLFYSALKTEEVHVPLQHYTDLYIKDVYDCTNRHGCEMNDCRCTNICAGYQPDKHIIHNCLTCGKKGVCSAVDQKIETCTDWLQEQLINGHNSKEKDKQFYTELGLNPNVQQAEDPEVRVIQTCKDYTDKVAMKLNQGLDELAKGQKTFNNDIWQEIRELKLQNVLKNETKVETIDESQWYCPICDHLIQPKELNFVGQIGNTEPIRYCYQCGERVIYHSKSQYDAATTKIRNEKMDKIVDKGFALRQPRLKIYALWLLIPFIGGLLGYGFYANIVEIIVYCVVGLIFGISMFVCLTSNVGHYCSKCHSTLDETSDVYCPNCHAAFLN